MTDTVRNISLAALGERVRLAVETLIQGSTLPARITAKDTYVAATRMIMRIVVILFAEARELLPVGNPNYHRAYSLQGLREQLQDDFTAWPRLLGLFRLLYEGSSREDLIITRYRGGLFRPGCLDADGVSRALHAFEDPHNRVSDDVVHRLLDLLTHSPARVRRGGTQAWVDVPVDFSSLSPESIGILYEGLLDYELRPAEDGRHSLVRAGATRKGAGTFYTPPQLAGSTVRRTLQPLTHVPLREQLDADTGQLEVIEWRPKLPEQILALRVCDPAMGSGSFLISALRWLTHALRESLIIHDRLNADETLEARLERRVVEQCIYGVDIDPVAVELARLALWLDTMDAELPLDFLDHKLRCGNAIIGCWHDNFQSYPIMAWEREGSGASQAIKHEKAKIKDALLEHVQARQRTPFPPSVPLREAFDTWCALWFWPEDALETAPTPRDLHAIPDETRRRQVEQLRDHHRFFHWELEFPEVFTGPGAGFDAILGNPPWDIQKPSSKEFFSQIDPRYRTLGKQEALIWQQQAFETSPDLEREWLTHQARFKALSNWVSWAANPFGDPERDPEGKGCSLTRRDNVELHRAWRELRGSEPGYSDPQHPFGHQGSADLNSYKLFVELAHALLAAGGRFGMIVPSGLYTDKGTASLRELLLDSCRWEWLFGFENRDGIFGIHRSFKFAAIVVEKASRTESIRAAFMRRDLADWDAVQPRTLAYPRTHVAQFCPKSKAILELSDARDLAVLQKLYGNGVLLGGSGPDGWGIEYTTEFHMTSDSKLFAPRETWERKGYRPDEYGHWLAGGWQPYSGRKSVLERKRGLVRSRDGQHAIAVGAIENVALPLAQGGMVHQFDCWAAEHVSGSVWKAQAWGAKQQAPQYLMDALSYRGRASAVPGIKFGFRSIARATDTRTIIGALLDDVPCGNALGVLSCRNADPLGLACAMNSWIIDWATRQRLGGTNVNMYVAEELPLPRPQRSVGHHWVIALNAADLSFTRLWLSLTESHGRAWRRCWAVTRHERLRLRTMLDALVAASFDLSIEDFAWILRGCDAPVGMAAPGADPRGFWRVDKECVPELRHSVLSLVAFHELERLGLERFMSMNDGEGWMLPETVRLADYGLGHDDRARQHQVVAAALGPRFHDWQLAQTVEHSWEECARHAELRDQILPLPTPRELSGA
jgi:hypothetical protein